MVAGRARLDPGPVAGEPEAQAEVGVLVVEEVLVREAAELLPDLAPDRQAGAGGEGDLARARRAPAIAASPAPPAQAMPV